jgi:hypothetical protein
LTFGTRAGSCRWGDGGEWFKVRDAGVVTAAAPGMLATEEGTGWRVARLRTGCRKSCVGRSGELSRSHKDEL